MSNASNNVVLMGTVMTNVQFLTTKKGVEFAARFMLAVKKGYKNADGYQATDLIPIRIKGEKRMGFARMIHKNDRICLSGLVSSEQYDSRNGSKVFSVCIDADHIEWANNKKRSQGTDSESRTTADNTGNRNPVFQKQTAVKQQTQKPAAQKQQQSAPYSVNTTTNENAVEINLNFAELPFS